MHVVLLALAAVSLATPPCSAAGLGPTTATLMGAPGSMTGRLELQNDGPTCIPGRPGLRIAVGGRPVAAKLQPLAAAHRSPQDVAVRTLRHGAIAHVAFWWSNLCPPPASSQPALDLTLSLGGETVSVHVDDGGAPRCDSPRSPSTIEVGPVARERPPSLVGRAAGPAMVFTDAEHGWVAGRGGILATSDGGRSWRLDSTRPTTSLGTDGERVWGLGPGGLYVRAGSWRRETLGQPGLAVLQDAYGLYPNGGLYRLGRGPVGEPTSLESACGRFVARGTRVWRSEGRSWRLVLQARLQTGSGWHAQLACRGGEVWLLDSDGAAAGSKAYALLHSPDAGRTWKPVLEGLDAVPGRTLPSATPYPGPISIGLMAGWCPACTRPLAAVTVVRTADGGRTWRRTNVTADEPVAIQLAGERVYLLATLAGVGVVSTSVDGGATWHRVLRSPRLTPVGG